MAQASEVYNIDNYMVLGKHCKGVCSGCMGYWAPKQHPPRLITKDQCRQWWWLEPVVCAHSAAGAYIVVEVTTDILEVKETRANNRLVGVCRGPRYQRALL